MVNSTPESDISYERNTFGRKFMCNGQENDTKRHVVMLATNNGQTTFLTSNKCVMLYHHATLSLVTNRYILSR